MPTGQSSASALSLEFDNQKDKSEQNSKIAFRRGEDFFFGGNIHCAVKTPPAPII